MRTIGAVLRYLEIAMRDLYRGVTGELAVKAALRSVLGALVALALGVAVLVALVLLAQLVLDGASIDLVRDLAGVR